jgi:tRNA pseudouridine38-40 synthase
VITFKLILEYDGTRYSGWQDQKNSRTVMGELRKAASQIFSGKFEMQGAGRTDSGVHALGQAMHLQVESDVNLKPPELQRRMNELLPADIAILHLERTRRMFHARHDAQSRVYLYQISRRKQAFTKKFVWWVKEPLDVEIMKRCAATLAGRHDFICFRALDASRPHESTVVEVLSAEIEAEDDIIQFRIEASHFIWRMVRRLVGVLVKVGKGEITEADFAQLLAGRSDPRLDVAAWTAPAAGLFLEEVRYSDRTRDQPNH